MIAIASDWMNDLRYLFISNDWNIWRYLWITHRSITVILMSNGGKVAWYAKYIGWIIKCMDVSPILGTLRFISNILVKWTILLLKMLIGREISESGVVTYHFLGETKQLLAVLLNFFTKKIYTGMIWRAAVKLAAIQLLSIEVSKMISLSWHSLHCCFIDSFENPTEVQVQFFQWNFQNQSLFKNGEISI